MISWTISVEPVTSKTASTYSYQSGGILVGVGLPTTTYITVGERDNDSTFRTENWSQTIQNVTRPPLDTLNGTTVRGTTNSTIEGITTADAGNFFIAQTLTRAVTVLGTQASQTSTTTSGSEQIAVTAAGTSLEFVYTTTSNNTTSLTTKQIQIEITAIKTVAATRQITKDTTTTSGSHLNNVIAATVYQADSNAEVLWVANQSLIADGIASSAASEIAVSTTRTTIYPDTDATFSYTVLDESLTMTSDFGSTSRVSENFFFTRTVGTNPQTTFVRYENAIPQITTSTTQAKTTTQTSGFSTTIFESSSVTAVLTTESTQIGTTRQKTNDTVVGLACNRTFSSVVTRTAKAANTLWTTTSSSTQTATGDTASWTTNAGGSADSFTVTGLDYSFEKIEEAGVTAMSTLKGHATTAIAPQVSRIIEKRAGVRAPDNAIAGFYNANGQSFFAYDAFVFASRFVSTANPTSFLIYKNIGDLEDIDLEEFGSASLSGLSGSATTTTSDGSQTSSSFTFELAPAGAAQLLRDYQYQNLASCDGVLGVSETAFVTVPRGAYKLLNGQTVFREEQVFSYTDGSGIQYMEPVTYFDTTSATSSPALVWTAPRNSIALP